MFKMSDAAPALLIVLITILRKWLHETLTAVAVAASASTSTGATQLRTSTYELPSTYLPSL